MPVRSGAVSRAPARGGSRISATDFREYRPGTMFDTLWRDYAAITPSAPRVQALLEARGERIVNDHVAFRTFDLAPIALDDLAPAVTSQGYVESGRYVFEEKKLRAVSFRDPDGMRPRIFLSELLTGCFSPALQAVARGLAAQVERRGAGALTHPPGWAPVALSTYRTLLAESEYAGWLAAFGLRANHFTVSVNALRTFAGGLPELNAWLVRNGFALNEAGGVIKGTPADLLEQSATLADRVEVAFAAGETAVIPSCYVEFALRHPDPVTGALFEGFVAKSADRIFESTDARR